MSDVIIQPDNFELSSRRIKIDAMLCIREVTYRMAARFEPPLHRSLAFEVRDGVNAFTAVNQSVIQVGAWSV
jgi:hypothetical protein